MGDRPETTGRGRAHGRGRGQAGGGGGGSGSEQQRPGGYPPRQEGGRGRGARQGQQGGGGYQGQQGGGGYRGQQQGGGGYRGQQGGGGYQGGQQGGGGYKGGQQGGGGYQGGQQGGGGYRGQQGGGYQGGQRPPPQPQAYSQQPMRDAPVPSTSVWGKKPTQQPAPVGRASAVVTGGGDGPSVATESVSGVTGGNGNGNGNGAGSRTRGNIRGNRSLHESIIRTRPVAMASKQGSHGTPVRLTANYFQLVKQTDMNLHQYDVAFAPALDSTSLKKRLVHITLKESGFAGYIFDGTNLYSTTVMQEFTAFGEDSRIAGDNDDNKCQVKVTYIKPLEPGNYQYFQVFNIIMRKCLYFLNLTMMGRNYFDSGAAVHLRQQQLELWPGYVTSIRQNEEAVLLCAEITHKVLSVETAYTVFEHCYNTSRSDYRRVYESEMLNAVVMTTYNNRTYTITDIDFDKSPNDTFKKNDGVEICYKDYFKQKYNLIISNNPQPLLISKSKNREIRAGMPEYVYLIPETCRLTGLTDNQRNNFNLMRALADETRVGPEQRVQKLLAFCKRLTDNEKVMAELRQWNMELANRLVTFTGRELPQEQIASGNNMKYFAGDGADWTRELRNKPLLANPTQSEWVVIVPSRERRNCESFVQMLIKAAKGMNYNLPNPAYIGIENDRIHDYMSAIEKVVNERRPNLLFVVLKNNKSDKYSAIKTKCYVQAAILSQVIVSRNLTSKGAMSIATKVAIQINAKLGGVPWTLHVPVSKLMVIGFDVCHDTQHRDRRFGAFVASMDSSFGRYFSIVRNHAANEEISSQFVGHVQAAVQKYRDKNGYIPDRIVIYRDGVGEGQLNQVIDAESNNLLADLPPEQRPKITFIVVSKRINTRIFSSNGNPRPGTVVDDVITLPERYDFFIVSQCVRQGTVSPTSYNVIRDESGWRPDLLQRLTYKMTHMYFNWSGTVRVPAPCQYAHKLAFLAGQHLHHQAHSGLEQSLYFL